MRTDDDPIDALLDGEAAADRVERWLDDHPLPVDEGEVARSAARVRARLAPRRARTSPWVPLAVAGAALAAIALVAARLGALGPSGPVGVDRTEIEVRPAIVPEAAVVREVDAEGPLLFPRADRRVVLGPGAEVLASEKGRTAVLLVRSGSVEVEGAPVAAGHWVVLTRTADRGVHQVVFPDGVAPPALPEPPWEAENARSQLRDLRWRALPEVTRLTLDVLLEDP